VEIVPATEANISPEHRELLKKGWRLKYGRMWPPIGKAKGGKPIPMPDVEIELRGFAMGRTPIARGGESKVEHAKRFITLVWGRPDIPEKRRWQWNPNACEMIEAACEERKLSFGGHASSTKTNFMAIWPLLNFFADPVNTICLLTSVTMKEAKRRIWGVVEEYWQDAETFYGEALMPGKLVPSQAIIRYRNPATGHQNDRSGLALVAGDPAKEKENIQKLIGLKAPKIIVCADELSELSESIAEAFETNLIANNRAQFLAGANPKSYFDPWGKFSEPEGGWNSITVETRRWRNKNGGLTIHFDGETSANVVNAVRFDSKTNTLTTENPSEPIWNGMLTLTALEEIAENEGGKNSPGYWRMVRAFPSPVGQTSAIYSEHDFIKYQAGGPDVQIQWTDIPIPVAGCDPAWTQGGDRAIVYFGLCGMAKDPMFGRTHRILKLTEFVKLDISKATKEADGEQVIRKLIEECKKRGVLPNRLGFDVTGGGSPLSLLIGRDWSNDFLKVHFGGSASDREISPQDKRKGKDVYSNRVSELWHVGLPYLRAGQIKGFHPDLINDLTRRAYEKSGGKTKVESKDDMKSRGLPSPDIGDAYHILLELCRHRMGLASGEKSAKLDYSTRRRGPVIRSLRNNLQDLKFTGGTPWG